MTERSLVRIPAGAAGEFSSPVSTFSVLTLISVSVPPRVTAVALKRSQSFCQKCRWQVTAEHTCLTYVALHEVTWCMVVWCTQNLHRDGCSSPAMPVL